MGVSFLSKRDATRFASRRKTGFRELLRGAETEKRRKFLKKAIKSVKIRKSKSKRFKKDLFSVEGM